MRNSMTNLIVREPLLNQSLQVLGYELAMRKDGNQSPSDADLEYILRYAGENLVSSVRGWLLGSCRLFLEVTPSHLSSASLQALPPDRIVLSMDGARLSEAAAQDAIKEYRKQGFGISLRNIAPHAVDNELKPLVTHLEINCSHANASEVAKAYGSLRQLPEAKIIGKDIDCWRDYEACVSLGLDAFSGKFYLEPASPSVKKELNPKQSVILKALDLLNRNADVGLVENELKHDPAIIFKLLRYINSAGIGIDAEVNSLRHAVTYLGYSTLTKWLSLLLATSNMAANAGVLAETAIIRGRFVELLSRKRLTNNEADQLFIAGVFSLLDRLLGIPMEEVLAQVRLSKNVQDALLSRSGVFAPYLALAEACELKHGAATAAADTLRMTADRIDTAHLGALAWARQIQA
jgi:EAL and modified HD-GYP domain-containing signal transduction protein